jgi:hypothetical protein
MGSDNRSLFFAHIIYLHAFMFPRKPEDSLALAADPLPNTRSQPRLSVMRIIALAAGMA